MCGIFGYYGRKYDKNELLAYAEKIKHRGPDSTNSLKMNDDLLFVFHRLAINGLNPESDQPIQKDGVFLICNGEIFNYKDLIKKYKLENDYKSGSDCEIILHLYLLFGINMTCRLLDGEFAFILFDSRHGILYTARDHLGIRSLYMGQDINDTYNPKFDNEICFSSELKAMPHMDKIVQFPVGSYWSSETQQMTQFFDLKPESFHNHDEELIIKNIRELFTNAVEKRLMSDRQMACLLSGGLDSTTVTALVASKFAPYTLNTYSIGLKGSIDLFYAKIAANYFKTNHTNIELTEAQFLEAIEKTIIQIESYDTTSVRASVGNYLVSLYIKEHTPDTVIFCGDVSDEIFASYRGFFFAKNDNEFYNENVKMLENIQYFDVLRSDKSIAGAGLEARVPFSDGAFLKYCMGIDPKYKRFNENHIEKYLFRKAFEHLMPPELAWRVKTAFSDGVSNVEKPWYLIIKTFMDEAISDEEFENRRLLYKHNRPYDKESLYYRIIFEEHYPNLAHTIPYFWKQPCTEEEDPSAWSIEA